MFTLGAGPPHGVAISVALRGRDGGGTIEMGDEVAGALRASQGGGDKPHVLVFGGNNCRGAIDVAPAVLAKGGTGRGDFASEAFCVTGPITHALRAEGADASEDGTGRGTPIVAFPARMSGTQECAGPADTAPAVQAQNPTAIATGYAVRRLTLTECERLQGMPDGHTAIPRGNPQRGLIAKDGPRYKAIGNSMAVSVMRWIGRRICRANLTQDTP
jgi:DNA (cytosine-5)-methyltransferase 1